MTSCSKFNDDNDETNEEQSARKTLPLRRDDEVLTILEALPEEICEQIIVAIRRAKLYVEKVKDVPLMSIPTQCAIVIFIDDNFLLGFKPYNHPLFVPRYI